MIPQTPNCDIAVARRDDARMLSEFFDFLDARERERRERFTYEDDGVVCSGKSAIRLVRVDDPNFFDGRVFVRSLSDLSKSRLIAEFLGVDYDAMETEKQAILDSLRAT